MKRFEMAAKISKKQRVALKQIDELTAKHKRKTILGVVSIGVMALVIFVYNALTYQLGIIPETNTVVRAAIYLIAMVIAGYCGIMFMQASREKRKIDALRQQVGISRETLDAWKRGEFND